MIDPRYKRYNSIVLTGYVVILAFLCFAYMYLVAGGENLRVDDIAQKQQKSRFLYLSALHESQTHLYKLSLYKLIRPDIVTLGSSRMLEFRGEDFKKPFVNMGLSMSSLAQGNYVADEMLKLHVPKVVILGSDFWWFSSGEKTNPPHTVKQISESLTPSDAMMTARWLYQGKISPKSMLETISERQAGYGIAAIVWKDGYDKYGSYHYTSVMGGRRPPNFMPEKEVQDIVAGKNVQFMNDDFDPTRLQSFKQLINKFVQAGSHVVVIIPPNYPDVNRLLSSPGKKGLVSDFRAAMRALPVRSFDFHDARAIGSGPCEFIDVWHGGEVTYLRILRALANSDTQIAAAIDTNKVTALISANVGRAEIVRSGYPIQHEVDFFGIGCTKGR